MKWSAAERALVPSAVVTVTSTVPQPLGAVAVSWFGELTLTPVAATPPKLTEEAAVKSLPETVTVVRDCPEVGMMPVTAGAENVSRAANVAHAQPVSFGLVSVPTAANSLATQTSVGFWGSMAAPA